MVSFLRLPNNNKGKSTLIKMSQLADDYTAGADEVINQLCWVGGFFMGCTPATFPDFTIRFFEDDGGVPHATNLVGGPFVVTPDAVDTGTDLFSSDEIAMSANIPDVAVAAGQTIWLSVITTSAPGCSYFLKTSINGGGNNALRFADGAPLNPGGNELSFFLGAVPPPVAAVPTLGQWGIIVLALSLLILGIVTVPIRKKVVVEKKQTGWITGRAK